MAANPIFALVSALFFFSNLQHNANNNNNNNQQHMPQQQQQPHHANVNNVNNFRSNNNNHQKSLSANKLNHNQRLPDDPNQLKKMQEYAKLRFQHNQPLFESALQKAYSAVAPPPEPVVEPQPHPYFTKSKIGLHHVLNSRSEGSSYYNPESPGIFKPMPLSHPQALAAAAFAASELNTMEETNRFHLSEIISAERQTTDEYINNWRMHIMLSDKVAHNSYRVVVSDLDGDGYKLSYVSHNKFI